MNSHGLQRVVDIFWSRSEENTDTENPIVVLGRTYTTHIRQEEAKTEDDEAKPEETLDKDKLDSSIADISVSDIKSYFTSFASSIKSQQKEDHPSSGWPEEFLDDVNSRIWLTYRTKFPPLQRDEDGPSPLSLQNLIRGQNYQLNGDFFTTDCGWGCMIRTGQTMLANAFLHLNLGRDWRFDSDAADNAEHDKIVSWFVDVPTKPFSIHNIVQKGRELSGKKAGEWFGPSAAARSIQALCSEFDANLRVYIGSDSGDVYEQDVFRVSGGSDDDFKPTLILLGVRLGIDEVNKVYWQSLKDILSSPESVGIAGGRPSSSHYFFGFQGDYLFYLDPHIPQPALKEPDLDVSVSESTEIVPEFNTQSVHTKKVRKIHISELDPSMLLGFLIKDGKEWYEWKQRIQNPESKNNIVHISPEQNPVSMTNNRKPSFVIVNSDGDDFIDVGLEYDDIPEEERQSGTANTGSTLKPDNDEDDEQDLMNRTAENESMVYVADTEDVANDETERDLPESVHMSRDTTASFENCSGGSIKDDYENIATSQADKMEEDMSNTVEVQSIELDRVDEPYVVVQEQDQKMGDSFVKEDDTDDIAYADD